MQISLVLIIGAISSLTGATTVGCKNCLGLNHAYLVAKCKEVVVNPIIGLPNDSKAINVAQQSCSKIVDRWNCCEPQATPDVCSSSLNTCTKATIFGRGLDTSVTDSKIPLRRRRDRTTRPTTEELLDLEKKDAGAICCGVAKAIFSGGLVKLAQGGINTADDTSAAMIVLISGWSISMACNIWFPMGCVIQPQIGM